MPDFSEARSKIERAKEHIRDLDRSKAAFLADNPYGVTGEYHPELADSSTVYFLDKFTPVPPFVSLIAGDAFHNLRTALDHLTVRLVDKGIAQGEPPRSIPSIFPGALDL